ncbi:hypothetical protein CL628_04640 [bacterium]|nr:hypothetical protein [bacterium]|tara:strand:- start:61 stop:645 length:585 start_codon:yes stop_codon:yes gene_type:complete
MTIWRTRAATSCLALLGFISLLSIPEPGSLVTDVMPAIPTQAPPQLFLPDDLGTLPLIYGDSFTPSVIANQLKHGAVVLPLGYDFGEAGNVLVAAHSSGEASFGSYRFAFGQLAELAVGEQFVVGAHGNRYTYQVYDTEIVWPHQIDHLPATSRSTVTLVTCWPLWTDLQRLLVHAELISLKEERDLLPQDARP